MSQAISHWDFDYLQHIGTWQVHGIIRNSAPIGKVQCLIQEITGDNLEVEPVYLDLMMMGTDSETGEMFHKTGTAVVEDLYIPGKWEVTIDDSKYKHTLFSYRV